MLMCAVQYELNQNLFISKIATKWIFSCYDYQSARKLTLRTNFFKKEKLSKFHFERRLMEIPRRRKIRNSSGKELRWCEINVSFGSCIIHIGWTSITTKCGTRKTAQKRSRYICNRVWMCVFVCKIFKRLTTKRVCV